MSQRREQVHIPHKLTKTRRCELLDLTRSSAYWQPAVFDPEDLALMRLIDELHLQRPFYGSRRIRDALEDQGQCVNRKRVQRLMQLMGIKALYPRQRTSQPGQGHRIYPYLLKGLTIERANRVWATDIVRHEAPCKRAEVKDLRLLAVAAAGKKLRAARPWRCRDRVESSPDNAVTGWHC